MCEIVDCEENFVHTLNADEYSKIKNIVDSLPHLRDTTVVEKSFEDFVNLTNAYQENPNVVDPKLDELISLLVQQIRSSTQTPVSRESIVQPFAYLTQLAKVRGPKIFIKKLPHEVDDFELAVKLLEENEVSQEKSWEVRYMCLLWLALLCKLPFSFALLCQLIQDEKSHVSLLLHLIQLGRRMMSQYKDKSNDACCLFLTELLSRKDVLDNESALVDDIFSQTIATLSNPEPDCQLAALKLLCRLFKRLNRNVLIGHIDATANALQSMQFIQRPEIMIRKLGVKLMQRVCTTGLGVEGANWLHKKQAKQLVASETPTALNGSASGNCEFLLSTQHLETMLDTLLKALKDKDSIVRWSAAKGIGRLTSKLPLPIAKHVAECVLSNFNSSLSDAAWHGGCLALAEMCRRGCLLPSQLKSVIGAVVSALAYNQLRASYSIGSHVRDAASYAAWSLARNFDTEHMSSETALHLGPALVCAALFDSEISCRRAASAAFQEIVGRLPAVFVDGLQVSSIIDYFAVGNRLSCYWELCFAVAQHVTYLPEIITHLLEHKISHYDQEIRHLASKGLGKLVKLLDDKQRSNLLVSLVENCSKNDSFKRNGSLLSLAQVLPHLVDLQLDFEPYFKLLDQIIDSKFTEGIGGDLTRSGINQYIIALCKCACLRRIDELRGRKWIDLLIFNLKPTKLRPPMVESMQKDAFEALTQFSKSTAHFSTTFKVELVEKFLRQIQSAKTEPDCIAAAFGLGAFSCYVISNEDQLLPVVQLLVDSIGNKSQTMVLWVEFRSVCLEALTTALLMAQETQIVKLSDGFVQSILAGLDDFTVSPKGDIGCQVRKAAINSLCTVLPNSSAKFATETLVGKLIELCGDKIDSVRHLAFDSLQSIINSPEVNMTGKTDLQMVMKNQCFETGFNCLVGILKIAEYSDNALLALINAIGSITNSISNEAQNALWSYLKADEAALSRFMQQLLVICQECDANKSKMRLIGSLLKCIQIVLDSDLLESFNDRNQLDSILEFVNKKCANSLNEQRLFAGISISCSLLQFCVLFDDFTPYALQLVFACLKHKYPVVRKRAAEQLHKALLKWAQLDNHSETVLSVLDAANWADSSVEQLAQLIADIKAMLKIV